MKVSSASPLPAGVLWPSAVLVLCPGFLGKLSRAVARASAASGSLPALGGAGRQPPGSAAPCSAALRLLVLGCCKKEARSITAVCCAFSARGCTAAPVRCSSAWMARGCTSPTPSTARGTSSSTRTWSSKKRWGGKGPLCVASLLETGTVPRLGGCKGAFVMAGGRVFLTPSPQLPRVELPMRLTHRLLWPGKGQQLPVQSCSARVLLGRAEVFGSGGGMNPSVGL